MKQKLASSLQSLLASPYVLSNSVRNQHRQRNSSFILPPSSLLSMSAQKSVNVWIVSFAQSFVGAAENYLAVAHHQNFAVD